MPVKVRLTLQNREPEIIVVDKFDIKADFYDYITGKVKDPNGNLVSGILIGDQRFIRLIDVVDLKIEQVDQDNEIL